jgi:PRC-barrel domain
VTTAEQLEQWRGRHVVDVEGQDLGKLDDVYYQSTGEPVLIRVTSGFFGRKHALVPLTDSSVGRDYLRVGFRRDQVEQASTEAADVVDADAARSVASAYGIVLPDAESGYLSSVQIEARRVEAQAARERAEALEAEARRRADDADATREHAVSAHHTATQAEHDAAAAAAAAAEARVRAEAAAAQTQQ